MINALNVVFIVMKKIVANTDVLDLKNGKRKKKLKIIVQNVVNENRISKGEIDMGKKNKPRWKDLNMYERLARRCKQRGGYDEWVEWLRQKAIEKTIERTK